MSKERPILFSGPMVQAILDGRKTQTRRVVNVTKIKPSIWTHETIEMIRPDLDNWQAKTLGFNAWSKLFSCPYGVVGDRLWVREAFGYYASEGAYFYKADCTEPQTKHHPSIHMPREASRITLEITNVRVERLQDICESDAEAEGVEFSTTEIFKPPTAGSMIHYTQGGSYLSGFYQLWEKINGKKHPWDSNPHVWIVEFQKVK